MINETIDVRADVTEVSHGTEYSGNISFNGVPFQYSYRLDLPISELRRLAQSGSINDKVHFNVICPEGRPINVDDNCRVLFNLATEMLVQGIHDYQSSGFANLDPELRDYVGMFLHSSALGISATGEPRGSTMQTSFQMKTTPELEQLLEAYRK